MSAKIAVSSSITWLIGCTRPALGRRLAHRQRDVDGLGGEPRVERGVARARRLRAASAAVTRSFRPLIAGPCALRSSGVMRAERLQQRRDRAALAERGDAHGLERRLVRGGGDGGEQFCSSCAMSDMAAPSVMRGLDPASR